jgi:peptide/nickel transport system permease protein
VALLKLIKSSPLSARIGFVIIVANILACLLAPVIAPYSETEIAGDVWETPNRSHLLGTDQLGRDMVTRILYGARNTVSIALVITLIAFTIGIVFGFLAAVMGGWYDQIFSRFVDVIMAFPTLIFALMVLSVLGTSIPILIGVISVLDSTRVYRLARALGMDIQVQEYVEVARMRGEGIWWVMRHEILPNAWPPLLAEFGMRFCFVFLFIAALSFLGLGIQPPLADWGGMVRENAGAITFGIFAPLWPAGAIAILTIGVNLVVDWFLARSGESLNGS